MMERVISDTGYIFGRQRLKEERGMSKRSVDGMVNRLHELKSMGKNSVIFGVLSGKLSEGIDYSDNILDAVVCIGLPLPPPSAKQDSLFEYYKSRFGRSRAWKYASLQPAINSVLQALGRPIRKAEDRAIVVLLEKRLLDSRSKDCMPESMDSLRTSSPDRTGKHVERFFKIPQSMGSS
jgi:DNA excision repair protein ERCC-2